MKIRLQILNDFRMLFASLLKREAHYCYLYVTPCLRVSNERVYTCITFAWLAFQFRVYLYRN